MLTDGILVLVRVDASVDHPSKQVTHDGCQGLRIQHPVQSPHEHRLAGIKPLRRTAHKVTVCQHPWDHLHLKPHTGRSGQPRACKATRCAAPQCPRLTAEAIPDPQTLHPTCKCRFVIAAQGPCPGHYSSGAPALLQTPPESPQGPLKGTKPTATLLCFQPNWNPKHCSLGAGSQETIHAQADFTYCLHLCLQPSQMPPCTGASCWRNEMKQPTHCQFQQELPSARQLIHSSEEERLLLNHQA